MPSKSCNRSAGILLLISFIIATAFDVMNSINVLNVYFTHQMSLAAIVYLTRLPLVLTGSLLTAIGVMCWKAVLIRVGCGINIACYIFSLIGYLTSPTIFINLLQFAITIISITVSIILILISVRSSMRSGLMFVPGILQTISFALLIIMYVTNGTFTIYVEYMKALFDGRLGARIIDLSFFFLLLISNILTVIAMWLAGVGLIKSKTLKVKKAAVI